MTKRDDNVLITHILNHSREAIDLCRGFDQNSFGADRRTCLAIARLFEIVGEAAGKLSALTKAKYPAVPWPDIIGMRNILIHAYWNVDNELLWKSVQDDLPKLIAELASP